MLWQINFIRISLTSPFKLLEYCKRHLLQNNRQNWVACPQMIFTDRWFVKDNDHLLSTKLFWTRLEQQYRCRYWGLGSPAPVPRLWSYLMVVLIIHNMVSSSLTNHSGPRGHVMSADQSGGGKHTGRNWNKLFPLFFQFPHFVLLCKTSQQSPH